MSAWAKELTYTDNVFVRAVEIGCEPVLIGNRFHVTWRCTCQDARHSLEENRAITWQSLIRLDKVGL